MVLDVVLQLVDFASKVLSLVTAILLFINNRPRLWQALRGGFSYKASVLK